MPKFYLRNFSVDGKRIGLINLDSTDVVRTGSIKHECSRRGFHDFHPEAEAIIGVLEDAVAPTLKSIIRDEVLPPCHSDQFRDLITFIVLQRSRTAHAAQKNDQFTDDLWKAVHKGDPRIKDMDLDKVKIANSYPAELPIRTAIEVSSLAQDLGAHLFVNDTRYGYITSDNPVVIHNRFCESIRYQGVLGWRSSGVQAIFPISPRHLLFFYDSEVYKVGRKDGTISHLHQEGDVIKFNEAQILNCQRNIYFSQNENSQELTKLAKRISKRRLENRTVFVEAINPDFTDGEHVLIHHYEASLRMNLDISKIRVRRAAKRLPVHQRGWVERGSGLRPIPPSAADRRNSTRFVVHNPS